MKCSFCGKEIKKGTGIMVVSSRGEVRYLHRKCDIQMKMKRKPYKLKWITKNNKK